MSKPGKNKNRGAIRGKTGKTGKTVKDCLYGQIRVSPLCQAFIDTPEFQRLRFIKQLGHVHYVYPSAVHTRFEHSLGVMHLAGKMVDALNDNSGDFPNGAISSRERELIELAGLLHDLGHMAYSHFFDHFVSDLPKTVAPGVTAHELRSLDILRSMNNRIAILTDEEWEFVAACILGTTPSTHSNRAYVFEIVNNTHCGVDVDKMDYLLRDAYHTGMHGFQSDYIIINACIDPETKHIAFAEKTRSDMRDLFATRQRMHENVYRHHTVRKIEKLYHCMMRQIIAEASDTPENTRDALFTLNYENDAALEIQLQQHPLYLNLQEHRLDHNCSHCESYNLNAPIHQSGSIDQVSFL